MVLTLIDGENMETNMDNKTKVERAFEILRAGCPYCGCDKLDMLVRPGSVEFQCQNPKCPSKGHVISLRQAAEISLPAKYAYMRKEAFKLSEEIEATKAAIKETCDEITRLKRIECKKRSHNCLVCKRKYEEVKNLKLYDKDRNRLYNSGTPYEIKDPKSGEILEIGSINTKRRAKALLSFRWFEAREKLAEATGQLADAREELLHLRTNLEKSVSLHKSIEKKLEKAMGKQTTERK